MSCFMINGSTTRHMKLFFLKFFLAAIFLLSMETPGFTEPCAPLQAFSNVVEFDRIASGQIVSLHDCNRNGLTDYKSFWTVVEFADDPLACQDPYDMRHLVVPRAGYYRLLADPSRVEVLQGKKERTSETLNIPSFRMRDFR